MAESLRQEIAENLYTLASTARYGKDFPEWIRLTEEEQSFFRGKADKLVLSLIIKRGKGIENPHYGNAIATGWVKVGERQKEAFNEACQAWIKMLEEECLI